MLISGGMLFAGGVAASLVLKMRLKRFTRVIEVEAPPETQLAIAQSGESIRSDLVRSVAESSIVAANMATFRKNQPVSPSALDAMTAQLREHLGLPPERVS